MTKIDLFSLFLYYLSCFAFMEPVLFTIVGKKKFSSISDQINQLSCSILRKIFTMRVGDYKRITMIGLKGFSNIIGIGYSVTNSYDINPLSRKNTVGTLYAI